jgi:phosphotransferase system  glucose/maltose/N-acetylglucosamine-specific IIC component
MAQYVYSKIHPWSFGLALGIVWGLSLLIAGLVAMFSGWGQGFIDTMGTVYLGYNSTVVGSIIGAVWGFIDVFIISVIIAAVYNLILRLSGKTINTNTPEKRIELKRKSKQQNKTME